MYDRPHKDVSVAGKEKQIHCELTTVVEAAVALGSWHFGCKSSVGGTNSWWLLHGGIRMLVLESRNIDQLVSQYLLSD